MKKVIFTLFTVAFLAFLFSSNSGGRATSGGSGNTGAPSEGTCANCHSGGSYNPSLSVQIFQAGTQTPVTQYMAGITYDMKVTVTAAMGSPAGYGFQMVALRSGNTNAGSWSNPGANTKTATAGGRNYVEHGVGGTYSSTNTFTMKWTAPAAGTGAVTFYSSGNAINGNGGTGGDSPVNTSISITEMVQNISAGTASNVTIADVGNVGNGTDLQFTFSAATNQNSVGQYRVMLVKQANAAAFSLAAANAVATGRYTPVTPTANTTYSQTLSLLARDVNGDLITNGQAYVAFVLSVADGTNANVNALSSASNALTLQGVAGAATNLVASDVGNTGADLRVVFNKTTNENTVSAYRLFVVPTAGAAAVTVATAQMVMSGNFINVTPNGSATYTQTFAAGATDATGAAITNGQSYTAFVLSIADGTNAVGNTISGASNSVLLQTVAAAASGVTVFDTANTNTAADMLVYFNAAASEATVSAYRILVVESFNSSAFNLAAANAVTSGNYTVVTPNGSANYSTTLAVGAKDVTGAAIVTGTAYQIFVLSVADGTIAGTSTLAPPSADLTLNDPTNTSLRKALATNITVLNAQLIVRLDAALLSEAVQLELFDAAGRMIITKNLTQTENYISMDAFAKGVYFVRLRQGNAFWTQSVVR
jgi:trimeric autotransporter adhesin